MRDSACGTRVAMSAPLNVTRPASGRTKPSRISSTVDFPAPEGPTRIRISPAGTRKLSPSSAGPRAGSQVRRTFSKATVTPRACTVRTGELRRRGGRRRQGGQRIGGGAGVEALLIGGGEGAQRGEILRHQQQHEQRDARTGQRAGQRLPAIAQRDHHQGQRHRQVERDRGQERHPQHPHGAPAQLVGGAAEGQRFVAGAAVHDDGGDAAHAVEETRLQMASAANWRLRGDATRRCRTAPWRPAPAGRSRPAPGRRPGRRTGPPPAPASGAALARMAAGIQRANSPSTASMRSTTMLASSTEWRPRSSDGPAASRRVSASVRRRRRAVAPASKAACSASTDSPARSTASTAKPASSGSGLRARGGRQRRLQGEAGAPGLADGERAAGQAERDDRQGTAPPHPGLLAHPGTGCSFRLGHARDVAETWKIDRPGTRREGGLQPAAGGTDQTMQRA